MAKPVQRPAGIEIAALKTQQVQQTNLMQPGPGTAWEDRGTIGIPKAFFITCFRSITSPGAQWDQIRRLESTSDATAFAIGCGILAGISWVVHSIWLPRSGSPIFMKDVLYYDVSWPQWAIGSALQMVCAVAGMYLLLRLANMIYQKLIPHAVASKVPSALTYNALAYSLGPVLLVFIPIVGWLIALFSVMGLFIAAGTRRLRLGASTAIISGILTVLVVSVTGGAAYVVGYLVWNHFELTAVVYDKPEVQTLAP